MTALPLTVDLTRAGTHCPHCAMPAGSGWTETGRLADANLILALQVAVPMRIAQLAAMDFTERSGWISWWAHEAQAPIMERADNMMYSSRGKTKAARHDIANTFNHLAKGLAAAAFCPGGVTFAGRHWCTPPDLCPTAEPPAAAPTNVDVTGGLL